VAAYYKLTHMNIDIVELDAQGVRVSVELVAHARPADMTRPTPCEDWTLHGLISHMATQHYGFAAAAAGDGDPAAWRPPRLGSDPVADYRASAEAVLSAFSAAGILDRQFPLPEVSVGPIVPAGQAVSFHFVNYVVHSWDVARTLGLDVRFTPGLLEAALRTGFCLRSRRALAGRPASGSDRGDPRAVSRLETPGVTRPSGQQDTDRM